MGRKKMTKKGIEEEKKEEEEEEEKQTLHKCPFTSL